MSNRAVIVFFIMSFTLVFLVYYFFSCRPKLKALYVQDDTKKKKTKKKKKDKNIEVGELVYLEKKFGLKREKLNWKSLAFWISFIDALIISFVVFVVELIDTVIILKLMLAFVLLFGLIYALYEIYGRHLKKLQEKED